jgi:hypothetical protein
VAGWWFSPVSSTNKTDHHIHDITEILLKVALSTITPRPSNIGHNLIYGNPEEIPL